MAEKSHGGRPKTEVNWTTARRIKQLRENHRETQKDIGNVIYCSAITVARFEKGERGISLDILKLLAKHWNVPVPYLTGETDKTTLLEYYQELDEAESQGLEEESNRLKSERAKLDNFFSLCKFTYQNIFDEPSNCFLSVIDPDAANAPHKLISNISPNINSFFTDEELKDLFTKVHELIAFECFKKTASQ